MRGLNVLQLNSATMIEAVQEYLDKRFLNKNIEVTTISPRNTGGWTFDVTVKEKAPEPETERSLYPLPLNGR